MAAHGHVGVVLNGLHKFGGLRDSRAGRPGQCRCAGWRHRGIIVMHEGVMTAIVDRKDFSSELILEYATSEIPYDPSKKEG